MVESMLMCGPCGRRYNLKEREPIFLDCCDETSCRECVYDRMKPIVCPQDVSSDPNDTKGIIFQCSLCNEKSDSVPKRPNKSI